MYLIHMAAYVYTERAHEAKYWRLPKQAVYVCLSKLRQATVGVPIASQAASTACKYAANLWDKAQAT